MATLASDTSAILRPMLGSIRAVTHLVPDIDAVVEAYEAVLDHHVVDAGVVPAAAASAWDAPAMAGRRYRTLAPASGEAIHLRFIESPAAAGWRALTTHGWNATEIRVQDVDALAARLDASPAFTIIGRPKGLTRFPMIRAMQAIGPAGECLYFTEVGPGSGLDLAPALAFVGRVFIVVAGGGDIGAMFAAYDGFANAIDPPVETPVAVISEANGLPADTLIGHGLIRLPEGTLIELDAYPAITQARACPDGELPPGMAMVSFAASSDAVAAWGMVAEAVLPGPRRRAACRRGAAGERIELIEEEMG